MRGERKKNKNSQRYVYNTTICIKVIFFLFFFFSSFFLSCCCYYYYCCCCISSCCPQKRAEKLNFSFWNWRIATTRSEQNEVKKWKEIECENKVYEQRWRWRRRQQREHTQHSRFVSIKHFLMPYIHIQTHMLNWHIIFFGFTLIRDFLVSHVCINAALILLDSSLNTFQMLNFQATEKISICHTERDCVRVCVWPICRLFTWALDLFLLLLFLCTA